MRERSSASKRHATLSALAVGLAAACWGCGGAGRSAPARQEAKALPGGIRVPVYESVAGARFPKANVVVVTIDTLRKDHLAPYGASLETTAASRLAREGVLFERAVSHVPLTLPSHSSIFTGLYPPRHGVRDNGGFVLAPDTATLARRLQVAGYDTAGFVGSYVLAARWGLAQGHDTYDDSFDYSGLESRSLTEVERSGERVMDRALDWLEKPRRGSRPFYLWVHLYDPHEPYAPPEAYRRLAPTPYAGEVLYADAQVGRLLAALDAHGLRGRTLVVYLADHGEALGDHGEKTHSIFVYGSTLDVPLIVAPPLGARLGASGLDLAGRRVRGLARLVDVTPTVLDLVGLGAPSDLDGTSLLPLVAHEAAHPRGEEASAGAAEPAGPAAALEALEGPVSYAESYYPLFHHGWSELVVVETARWRWIRAPRPELYDRLNDPRERQNVYDENPRIAATLAAQLEAMALQKAGEPKPAAIDPEALERLRALGYVGGSGASSPAPDKGPRPDPKDRLPLLRDLQEAESMRDAGRLEDSARLLEELARKDPDNPEVPFTLASVHFRRKDFAAAIAAERRALALNPRYAVAVLDLAFAYKAAGRGDEAQAGFERVLELDHDNLKALLALGELDYGRGERAKAMDYYQRAATVAPDLPLVHFNRGTLALEMGRFDVADEALRRALALGGDRPTLHFNLGVIAEQRGQAAAAEREYGAEVKAYPDAYKAWVNLGLLRRQAGRIPAALDAFERAARARTDDMAGPYLLAETLLELGRGPEAEKWAREALARKPDDPRTIQLMQRLHPTPTR